MSLNLPQNFESDLQSRDTNLIPLVIIGTPFTGAVAGDYITISTNQWTNGIWTAKPLLLNIPSLKESIDIEKRNYKISSVNLDISNFPYEGERFSELVSDTSLINTEIRIFWVSPSVTGIAFEEFVEQEGIETLPDIAFQIFNGSVRKYTHDDEKIRLVVEDRSQATLHRDLPTSELGTDNTVPDKYKNKPIPMVYGHVDRSPCVIRIDNNDSIKLINDSSSINDYSADTELINQTMTGELFIYNGSYINIPSTVSSDYSYIDDDDVSVTIPAGRSQYITKKEMGYIELDILPVNTEGEVSNYILSPSPLSGQLVVNYIRFPESVSEQNQSFGYPDYTYYNNVWQNIDNLLNKDLSSHTSFSYLTDSVSWSFKLIIKLSKIDVPDIINISNPKLLISALIDGNQPNGNYAPMHIACIAFNGLESSLASMSNFDGSFSDNCTNMEYQAQSDAAGFSAIHEFNNFNGLDLNNYSFGSNDILPNYGSIEKKWVNHDDYSTIAISVSSSGVGEEASNDIINAGQIAAKIYKIAIYNRGIIYFNTNHNFYANVKGRGVVLGENFNAPTVVIGQIMEHELGINGAIDNGIDSFNDSEYLRADWIFDFTVNSKINSKRLIENIASASPVIPRFDNMGNFKFDIIPETGGTADHTIQEADVIDFSFSRSSINDVKSRIIFKYNWDYGKGDFNDSVTADTDGITIDNTDEMFPYYGLPDDHSESTITIDDSRGKYIRKHTTAENFAYWYLMWSCQQKLQLKIKLPLKWMNLEIGDLVRFGTVVGDNFVGELLGGIKPYGIDYRTTGKVTFQDVFTTFLITETNKRLDYVEISCTQMHNLDATCIMDCAGVCNGNTGIDFCGVCGGGNASCQDCNENICNNEGCLEGAICSGEGFETCAEDVGCGCGVAFGDPMAGGLTCEYDCNGDLMGTASLDSCGVCSGGNTGHVAGSDIDDCGDCFGENSAQDDCGVCNGADSCEGMADAGVDQSVGVLSPVTLDGSGSSTQGGNSVYNYIWTQVSGTTINFYNNPATPTVSFTSPDHDTTLVFSLIVSQNLPPLDYNYSAPNTVTIHVNNQPPTADAGANQQVHAGDTVTLNGSGSFSDEPIWSYVWSDDYSENLLQLNNQPPDSNPIATFIAPTITNDQGQNITATLNFQLTVKDGTAGDYQTGVDTVSITILPFQNCTVGDMNDDGNFGSFDINSIYSCISQQNCATHYYNNPPYNYPFACAADINGDGNYDADDILALSNCIAAGSCEDAGYG